MKTANKTYANKNIYIKKKQTINVGNTDEKKKIIIIVERFTLCSKCVYLINRC